MALDSPTPFFWGAGGSRLTPEEIAAQRKVANSLLASGMDYSPIASPWQGAARIAQAVLGGIESGEAGAASKANAKESTDLIAALLGGGASTLPATVGAPVTHPVPLSPATGGSPQSYFDAVKAAESSGNPNARSSSSSATGLYQFTTPTWNDLMRNRPDLGLTADGRLDPQQQERAMRAFTDQNAGVLRGAGIDASPANLYAAHFLGAGGARSVLGQPDNVPMVVAAGPEVVKANPFLANMTVGDFKAWTGRKVGGAASPAANPILGANQPSPLDTAQYPAGPIGAPDPAALPVNAQEAQGFVIPGQVTAPAPAQQPASAATAGRLAINPAILQAMTSPYVSDQTRQIATLLFKSQMDQQAKANDPMRQLQMEALRAKIAKDQGKGGTTEYGLNPVYGTDEQGNAVIGTLGKDGTFKRIDTGGVKVSTGVDKVDLGTQWAIYDKKSGNLIGYQPKNLKEAESQKALGKAQGGMQATLPSDIQNAETTVTQIDDLIKHPGLSSVVGPIDQFRPSWTMGAEGRDALARYNQLKGKAFLQAYTTLRGGGQITEVEGTKAENAMARMDRAQSEAEFTTALRDFRDAVKIGMQKLREKAGVGEPASQPSGGKRLRFNPATGALE